MSTAMYDADTTATGDITLAAWEIRLRERQFTEQNTAVKKICDNCFQRPAPAANEKFCAVCFESLRLQAEAETFRKTRNVFFAAALVAGILLIALVYFFGLPAARRQNPRPNVKEQYKTSLTARNGKQIVPFSTEIEQIGHKR